MKLSNILLRNVAAFMLLLIALHFKVANASPLSEWRDRKYIRDTWNITPKETSSAELDKLLNSKYPGTEMTWRALLDTVEVTDGIVAEAKQSRTEAAVSKAIDAVKKKTIDVALQKSLATVKLGFMADAFGWYQLLMEVNAAGNETALTNQVKLYTYARGAGISHEAIVNKTADGVEFDYNGKGWILGLEAHPAPISRAAIPTNMTSAQAWQVGKFLWDAKTKPDSFEQEKKEIGKTIREAINIPVSKNPTISIMEVSVGKPYDTVRAYFEKNGFSWEREHDNRYTIFIASKGTSSYTLHFARRADNNSPVCESIARDGNKQPFKSLAPADWPNYEAYIVRRIFGDANHKDYTHDSEVVLMKESKNGEYLNWTFGLDKSSPAIQCVATGNKWKMVITDMWTSAKITEGFSASLGGVKFLRNFSDDSPDLEINNPDYFKNPNFDGVAVKWKPGDKSKMVYFPRQQ